MSKSLETYKPILRWAGSKRQLLPTLRQYIPTFSRYVEPFAGSACLFFDLSPRRALLGDVNQELIETYKTIRTQPRDVGRSVLSMPISHRFYYDLRAQEPRELSAVERSARFIYLNRFCFNGVYRTNKKGEFNVPRGIRTGTLPTIADFVNWSSVLRRASFFRGDFEDCLSRVRPGDFVYLDPPYAKQGSRDRGEYGYPRFEDPDLSRLCARLEAINNIGVKFLLSYRYSRKHQVVFGDWNFRTVLVRRHVAGFVRHRASVREMLVSNMLFGRKGCRA